MTFEEIIFAFVLAGSILSAMLWVLFGQLTVSKLRKNPKTKDALGMEYAGGWDIVNVASALAMPRSWSRKLEKSPLSFIHAKSDLLFENTTKFDQILGATFYWLLMASGISGALLVFFNFLGLID